MAHPKKLEYTSLGGIVLQAAFVLVCLFLAGMSGSPAVWAEMWFVAVGLLV